MTPIPVSAERSTPREHKPGRTRRFAGGRRLLQRGWQDSWMPTAKTSLAERVCRWYAAAARDLPWRRPDVSPWAVLVSEVMLQQTPAARVVPAWQEWMPRWPTPADLAAQPAGEAVRAWGRLGYPRRALRLHAAARAVLEHHSGVVPDDEM